MSAARLRRPRPSVYVVVGALALVAIAAATGVAGFRREEQRQVRRYQAWSVDGPPCRPVPARTALRLGRKRFNVGKIGVQRESGHLACLEIRDNGGHGPGDMLACHMLAPGIVAVITPSGALGFDPGPGRSAATFVTRSKVTCVARAKAELFSASSQKPFE